MTSVTYYQEQYFTATDPIITLQNRGLLLGDGCFTTLKITDDKILHFKEHQQRLAFFCEKLYLPLPAEYPYLEQIILDLCHHAGQQDGVIRINCYRQSALRQIAIPPDSSCCLFITLSPTPPLITKPLKAYLPKMRINETSPLASIKTNAYLETILMLEEGKKYGANEVLFQNSQGHFVHFSVGNLLIETDSRQFLTPPPCDGCLEGIYLKTCGLPLSYQSITADMLEAAHKIYRTNCVMGRVPVDKKFMLEQINFN